MPCLVQPTRISYDPEADVFSVSFGPPTRATGYEICDQILLRVNPTSGQAAGVTIRNFSVHVRSNAGIPLTGLQSGEVPGEVYALLTSAPVNRFLGIAQDERGARATILQPPLVEAVAA